MTEVREVLISLLLVLAVAFAWPSMGNSSDGSVHSAPHHLTTVDAHATGHAHHDPSPVCSPDMGCCVMTHCHPGVAQPLPEVLQVGLLREHEPLLPAGEAGFDPAVLVPPPRTLLV